MSRTAMGLFPPTPKYTFENIPDLTGKVAIVTGANTGIGKVTARELLKNGAKVYIACRNEEKANKAMDDLKRITGKDDVQYDIDIFHNFKLTISYLKLDLGNIAACKASAREFQAKESKLDILVNNAGVMEPPSGSKSEDGYEMQWATNVLGPYTFTRALFPQLIEASKGKPAASVRVIWVSSAAVCLSLPEGVELMGSIGRTSPRSSRWITIYSRAMLNERPQRNITDGGESTTPLTAIDFDS